MRRVSTVILVIASIAVAAAGLPARADVGAGRRATHRVATHHAARRADARHLTVHRRAPVEATRDFDPVPPDPLVVGFFRSLDGYGTEAHAYAPPDLDQPFGPTLFRAF